MKRKQQHVGLNNEYAGWCPEQGSRVEVIQPKTSAEEFWRRCISQRKPAILEHPDDPQWRASALWTDQYLGGKVGSREVEVEVRDSSAAGFGHGRKQRMPFSSFLQAVSAGDSSLYLSTQEAPLDPDGHPELLTPPARCLAADFPLRPALVGALVPQSVNVWIGCAPEGASSGLHHDFHDNLYVLLRGRKRFRLWPPSAVAGMYMYGKPVTIHPNGRIVYLGQGDVAADGSNVQEVAQWQAWQEATLELEAAEEAAARKEAGSKARLSRAEKAFNAVMDAALTDDIDSFHDDFDSMEAAAQSRHRAAPPAAPATQPPSFSRIDVSLPPRQLRSRFPLFPGIGSCLECEVRAGQALYLPAGWFHEVTSFSGDGAAGPTHLALNYWFHPPDNLDPSPAGCAAPYTSQFWPQMWVKREARYKAVQRGEGNEARTEEGDEGGADDSDSDVDDGQARGEEVPQEVKAHIIDGMRGYYGYGRRQHLHRFINVHFR